MFERFTEKARRVIFFARYEAAQLGAPYIETEHLLLAILRECKDPLRLFREELFSYEELRSKVEQLWHEREKTPGAVDLPLSNESKRVLAHAAEEAEMLEDRHIGPEHLFLGLLREEATLACQLLNERGITLKGAREKIAADLEPEDRNLAPSRAAQGITTLHGANWRSPYLQGIVNQLVRFAWQVQKWKPRDILVDRQTGRVMFYTGQEYEEAKFQLTPGGWKRDRCVVCGWELTESDDPQHGLGYTNGRDWICTECYDKFFQPPITPLHDLYT